MISNRAMLTETLFSLSKPCQSRIYVPKIRSCFFMLLR